MSSAKSGLSAMGSKLKSESTLTPPPPPPDPMDEGTEGMGETKAAEAWRHLGVNHPDGGTGRIMKVHQKFAIEKYGPPPRRK